MKKRMLAILLTAMMILGLIGCGAKEPEITGKWVLDDDEDMETMEMFSDGTGILCYDDDESGEIEQYGFTWIAENGRLKLTIDFGFLGSKSIAYDYELTQDDMTLFYEGEAGKYNREEQ